MTKLIFSNQKGGVGKTTLCRELGLALADRGFQVLIIDADGQGNLTKGLCEEQPSTGLFDALEGNPSFTEVTTNLKLLAGDQRLALLEKRLLGEVDAYTRFRDMLADETFSGFDFIFLDTPPSLGVLTLNSLAAADSLIIPMRPALYSMQGTNDLMETISKVKRNLNNGLSILGVIINGFDSIPTVVRQIREEIEGAFGSMVFQNVLSRSIRIEEAIALKQSVSLSGRTKSSMEIDLLCSELLERLGGWNTCGGTANSIPQGVSDGHKKQP